MRAPVMSRNSHMLLELKALATDCFQAHATGRHLSAGQLGMGSWSRGPKDHINIRILTSWF